MLEDELPVAKDISLTQNVTIELPAHVWLSFYTSYMSSKWNNQYANMITVAVLKALFEERWLKEMDAAMEQQKDNHDTILRIFTGKPPDVPPHMEGL